MKMYNNKKGKEDRILNRYYIISIDVYHNIVYVVV